LTAAGVTVELGEDDAVELEDGVERLGRRHRFLADHGVDDEEGVVGPDVLGDPANLVHQLLVDGEAPGGVDDEDIASKALRLGARGAGHAHRVGGLAEHGHPGLTGQDAQLLHGRRTLQVGAGQHRVTALLAEPTGELGGGRRLA